MRKKIIFIITLLLMSISTSTYAQSIQLSNKTTDILNTSMVLKIRSNVAYVNNQQKSIDTNPKTTPIIKNGKTLLPLRFVAENLGATVEWDVATSSTIITKDDKTAVINKNEMTINSEVKPLDVPLETINDVTYISVRNLADALDQRIYWNQKGIILLNPIEIGFRAEAIAELQNGDTSLELNENDITQKSIWIENQVISEIDSLFPPESIIPEEKPPVVIPPTPPVTNVNGLVVSGAVIGKITKNAPYYSSYNSTKSLGTIPSGTEVEIIRDKNINVPSKSYQVKSTNGKYSGWVRSSYVTVPSTPAAAKDRMTQAQLESYVNGQGLKSSTSYLIWVDLHRQLVHIFIGKSGDWKLAKSITCASGKNTSPTIRGTFKVTSKGTWLDTPPKGDNVGVMNWLQFYGDYLFHSVIVDSKGKIKDNTQEKRVSNGCIRLPFDDSKWMYNNIPMGTTVYIY